MATQDAPGWRNRIVGEGQVAPDQLLANPHNWRIHPHHQKDALAGVLGTVGWVQRIIVNQRTQHVIDGHARIEVAMRNQEPLVPVVYVDVSEAEEHLLLTALDPLAALAGTDKDKLSELLHNVTTSDAAVMQMLEGLAIEHRLIPPMDAGAGAYHAIETPDEPVAHVDGAIPESNVRMCQLFLTDETYQAFQQDIQRLGAHFGTTTLTDTVLEAIRYAADMLDHTG